MKERKGKTPRIVRFLCMAALLCQGVGCTHMAKISVTQPAVTVVARQPIAVALVLDPAFCNYQYQVSKMGDKFVWPFGASLCDYARNVTQGVFEHVDLYDQTNNLKVTKPVAAVFHPKVAKVNQLLPSFAWQKRQILLVVEWTMKDGQDDKTMWVGAIEGAAEETTGNLFTGGGHDRKIMQALFDDLTRKTQKALMEAPEVNGLKTTR
jgi:hypothetical protein